MRDRRLDDLRDPTGTEARWCRPRADKRLVGLVGGGRADWLSHRTDRARAAGRHGRSAPAHRRPLAPSGGGDERHSRSPERPRCGRGPGGRRAVRGRRTDHGCLCRRDLVVQRTRSQHRHGDLGRGRRNPRRPCPGRLCRRCPGVALDLRGPGFAVPCARGDRAKDPEPGHQIGRRPLRADPWPDEAARIHGSVVPRPRVDRLLRLRILRDPMVWSRSSTERRALPLRLGEDRAVRDRGPGRGARRRPCGKVGRPRSRPGDQRLRACDPRGRLAAHRPHHTDVVAAPRGNRLARLRRPGRTRQQPTPADHGPSRARQQRDRRLHGVLLRRLRPRSSHDLVGVRIVGLVGVLRSRRHLCPRRAGSLGTVSPRPKPRACHAPRRQRLAIANPTSTVRSSCASTG